MRRSSIILGCAAGMLLAATAIAADHASMPMGMQDHTATSASSKAYQAAMMKMHHAMDIAYTGDADTDFVNGMVPHHQGAVEMAEIELQYGKDPELRKLANDIIAAQKKEIAFMEAWRKQHAATN